MPTIPTARLIDIANAMVTQINTNLDPLANLGSAAIRGISLGFTDSEIARLKIVVRPNDYTQEQANVSESDLVYKIEIGIMKLIAKTTAASDPLINLAIAIARIYQPETSFAVASGDNILCTGATFMPLYYHDPNSIDSTDSTVRFDCRIHVEFRELGRSKASTT